jgi:hypothetical protein
MACINPNNPTFQTLAKKLGSYMLAEVEFSKLQKEDFVIQNNGTFLNTSEEKRKEIFENYVNLMDRKREGKSISFDKFNQMFDNLQVFKHKNTFIFGEWDVKNNVFKGRLMSSPGIKELYGALDVLFANTDFVASVPSDIGSMLERKGLYKLDIGKEYNFKGEEMVKNLYFSNKELVEKIFKTTPENVTTEQVKKYDEFFNYWSLINKLKKEYESKNFDNLLSILKEIGIYDYNAYKLVKKIKQGKITNADTEAVVKEIIKNSAINKVNIDNTDLINNPKVYDELNTELNKTLATYLSKFGVKTELLEDMQDELGIDSFAHIDILNKILYADKNNQENYPQQAGKTIAFMMQHNPYMQEITSKMKKLSMFKGLTNDELFEAVGDLISEELHKKTNTELPKDLIESIKNLIKQFFDFLNDIQMSRINKNIGFIADNILLQNQSLITQSVYKPGSVGKKVSKISLEEALKSDVFGNSIVEKMAKYFILTGSITLSEQGTVYRPNENQIHDLDWVSSLTREKSIKIFNELYPNNKYIRNIYNPEYQTDTWLIAPEGYKIENLKIDNSKKTNKIIGYDIVDLNNKIVSSYIPLSDSHTGKVEAKLIDIFSYEKVTEKKTANKEITLDSGTKLKIADWRNTFEAKLKFGRLKDIWDYNRFIPNDNIYKEKTNYISGVKLGVEELFNENPELANEVYEALGFRNKHWSGHTISTFNKAANEFINKFKGKFPFRIVGSAALSLNNKLDRVPNDIDLLVEDTYSSVFYGGAEINENSPKFVQEIKKVYGQTYITGGFDDVSGALLYIPELNLYIEPKFYSKEQLDSDKSLVQDVTNIKDEKKIWNEEILQITPQQKQQALQVYSQYLESLNKPNTNPVLQGNQQEQVKKFAELQERLNNKEFLEGAKNAFESSKELQNVYYEAAGFSKQINEIADTKKVDEFIKKYKEALPNIKDGKTLISHLQTISNRNTGTTKQFADLIIKLSQQNKSLEKLLNNPNLYAKPDGVGDEGAFHWSLFNNLSVNKIVLELDHFKTNTYDDVFLHELIHNLTTQFIVKDSNLFNQDFYNKVKELYSVFDNHLENNRKVNEPLLKSTKEDIKNIKRVIEYFNFLPSDAIQQELIFGKIGSISTIKNVKLDFKSLENKSKKDVLQELNILLGYKENRVEEIEKGDKDYYYFNSKTFKQENVLSEFLATFMNNAEFREQLKNIDYKNNKSLFQKIVDLVGDFLGLTKNESLYNEFILNLTKFINNNDYSSVAKQTIKTAYENRINLLEQQKQDALNAYTDYLARVSLGIIKNPSSGEYNYYSKVKDIVYHFSTVKIDKPNKEKFSLSANINRRKGFFGISKNINPGNNFANVEGTIPHAMLFDMKNPDFGDFSIIPPIVAKDDSKDSAIIKQRGDIDYYSVFEPEQIHILGSKQDIEGFKKFVEQPIIEEIKEIKPEGLPSIDRTNKTCK